MNGLDVDLYAWAAARELERLKATAATASRGARSGGDVSRRGGLLISC